jgi:serine/threonine protein kinase
MAAWNPHANELFLEALERPAGPARTSFLDEVCRDDEALRAQVLELLNGNDRAGEFLSSPVPELPQIDFYLPRSEQPGSVIGPYKLLQEIGEGGMGVVYMAEQSRPVRRTVALKILKPGMDSRQVVARFEAERQALALMDHPNIAKVLDAGTVGAASRAAHEVELHDLTESPARLAGPTGRPYFVMELVKGIPITKYCDEHRLTPRERLELFVPVCKAVQHAHQKGVIHRDLKPSNVMVARYDGQPVPKVIDFGVAKAVGARLTEQTMFTEFGAVIGTLEYMSPEQAELNQLDVDTRSDVYSLGVILYELLTGTTPLEHRRSKDSSIMDVLRLIREETPPTPSTRISTTAALPAIAANRGVDPGRLCGLVRGELDWVVMKALEKDRNRRYPTANSLALDIEHYLANERVDACPPSAAYRFQLFARRNKAAMTVAAVVAASLVYGTIVSTWQATQARRAAALAEQRFVAEQQARQQALAALSYSLGDKSRSMALDKIVMLLIAIDPVRPAERVEVARVLEQMAHREVWQGSPREAERLARRSVDLRRDVLGDRHSDTATSLSLLGDALQLQGRLDESELAYRRALEIFHEHYEDHHPHIVTVSGNLVLVAKAKGDQSTIDEVRKRAEKTLENTDSDLKSLDPCQSIFVILEEWALAEKCSTRRIQLEPLTVEPRYRIALLQLVQRNYPGYRDTCRAAVVQGMQLGDFHSEHLAAWTCLMSEGSGVDIERIAALNNKALGVRPDDIFYRQAADIALYRAGRLEEAETQLLASISANSKSDDDAHKVNVGFSRLFLAMTRQRLDRPQEAQATLEVAQQEAAALLANPELRWELRLLLKLWREEAERLIGSPPNPREGAGQAS